MTATTRDRDVLSKSLLRAGLLLTAAPPTLAGAQNYVFDINNAGSAAQDSIFSST